MIGIIDYEAGNLNSIATAVRRLSVEVRIIRKNEEFEACDKLVLPGVGAFAPAMRQLRKKGLDAAIHSAVLKGTPLLGICLGMQVFFDRGYEARVTPGLGLFKGKIRQFDTGVKVPHMGWNQVRHNGTGLFAGLPQDCDFYFAHSYYADGVDADVPCGKTDYGGWFVSAVEKSNVFGVQFHPEKSGAAGERLLRNFIRQG